MTLTRTLARTASVPLAALLWTVVLAAPAHALDAPVAIPDNIVDTTRTGSISTNLLDNDTWDPEHTVEVTDVRIVSAQRSQYPRIEDYDLALNPKVTWTPEGDVTIAFGPYDFSAAPSVIREARLIYEMTDDAGQHSQGAVVVREQADPSTPSVADDSNEDLGHAHLPWATPVRQIGNTGDPIEIEPLTNDRLGPWQEYRLEVVSQPGHGTVTVPGYAGTLYWMPPADAYTERTDTFSYRACWTKTDMCSNAATVAITTAKPEPDLRPVLDLQTSRWFWNGGPTADTLNPAAIARGDERLADEPTLTAVLAAGATELGALADNGDGSWAYSWSEWPTPREDGFARHETPVVFDILDGAGTQAATVAFNLSFREPDSDGGRAAVLADDEVWSAVGQTVPILPFANDPSLPRSINSTNRPVGVPGWEGWPIATTVTAPTLGALSVDRVDLNPVSLAPSMGLSYTAGDQPGLDEWAYEICQPYPTRRGCETATARIHVTPLVTAIDDTAAIDPGTTAVVDVLMNDLFTDRSDTGDAQVTLTDIPDGVGAEVLADRSIQVTIPDGFPGDEVAIGYRLRDYTGGSEAQVVVSLSPPPVVDPPVVDPPVVDPPVVDPPVVEPPVVEPPVVEPPVVEPPVVDPPVVDPPVGPQHHWVHWICHSPPAHPKPQPRPEPPLTIDTGGAHPARMAASSGAAVTSDAAPVIWLLLLLSGVPWAVSPRRLQRQRARNC